MINKNWIIGLWLLVIFSIAVTATIKIGSYGSAGKSYFDKGTVINSSSGDALQVQMTDRTSGKFALNVIGTTSGATGTGAFSVKTDNANYMQFYSGNSSDAYGSFVQYRALPASFTTCPVMYLFQDEATDDQHVLKIRNDGTGSSILLDSNLGGITMKDSAGTAYCFKLAIGGATNITSGACTK